MRAADPLVIDASAAIIASARRDGFKDLGGARFVAPALMWSEARSSLHQMRFRGQVDPQDAELARRRIESCPVERIEHEALGDEAWTVAEELGWAKTYDAEYLALARLLGCKVLTVDASFHRGAARFGIVISPGELQEMSP